MDEHTDLACVRARACPACVASVERLTAENERLRAAIEWALGMGEDFPPREQGQGPYWWRNELSRRAGITLEPRP